MIRHIVWWTLKPEAEGRSAAENAELMKKAARGLIGKIPGLLSLDISGNYNPWTLPDDKSIKHWLVQPELRYWLHERFNGHFLGVHAL